VGDPKKLEIAQKTRDVEENGAAAKRKREAAKKSFSFGSS